MYYYNDVDLDDPENFDSLGDPLDDGSGPLAPAQFDPLCELRGEPWPADSVQAASFEYEIAHW